MKPTDPNYYNVGYGPQWMRTRACIRAAWGHPNVVTRHICRQILREKIARAWRNIWRKIKSLVGA